MNLMLVDESNQNSNQGKFFILGSLVFHLKDILCVDDHVRDIRKRFGLNGEDLIKFNIQSKPEGLSKSDHNELKLEILRLCKKYSKISNIYLVHHGISKNQIRRFEFGANTLLHKYQNYLVKSKNFGFCLFDHENHFKKYLESVFINGLFFETSNRQFNIDRILLLGLTTNASSNLSSLVDVFVGAFRFGLNHLNDTHEEAQMFFHESLAVIKKRQNIEISPKKTLGKKFAQDYVELKEYLSDYFA